MIKALHLKPGSPYDLHWPMRYSDFNVKGDRNYPTEQSLEVVFNNLEKLWGAAIEQYLEIPPEEFRVGVHMLDSFSSTNIVVLQCCTQFL